MRRRKVQTGFSLLELLAVVTIIGIIAGIVVSRLSVSRRTYQENACFHNRSVINGAIEFYYIENGDYPTDLTEVQAMPNFPDILPVCPVSGAAYTIDPTTHRVNGHTAGSH